VVERGAGQGNMETARWMEKFVIGGCDMTCFDEHEVEEITIH
jgi:hypothetical protein